MIAYSYTFELVLVKHQDVEPLVGILERSLEPDGFGLKCDVESFVLDMSQPVQGNPGLSPLEEYRSDLDLFHILNFPKVVQIVVDARLVQTRKHVKASWIIMIPMNTEDWQLHRERWIQIVCACILVSLKLLPLNLILRSSENMFVEDFGSLVTTGKMMMSHRYLTYYVFLDGFYS